MSLTLGGLSAILVRESRVDEALTLAEESLNVALSAAGEQSLDAALAYANVASVHKWARRYDPALPLYRKSMKIYEQLAGPDHPRVAGILTEIGLIEMEDHNYPLAERDMQPPNLDRQLIARPTFERRSRDAVWIGTFCRSCAIVFSNTDALSAQSRLMIGSRKGWLR